MAGKLLSLIVLVVGVVILVLRFALVTKFVDLVDSFGAGAILVAGGTIGFVLSEHSKEPTR